MNIVVQIGQFLLSLSLLIILHEGGHYLAARLFKTRVEKFYLFFDFLFPFPNLLNFSLFKIKKGDTEYGLGWFPLGGYVKIAGMVDESTDSEALKTPPQPWEYRSKKAWQRLIIILGGIIVNLILGFFIYIGIIWFWGETIVPPEKVTQGVHFTDPLSYSQGFRDGDVITKVDDKSVRHLDAVTGMIILEEASSVEVVRDGKSLRIPISPEYRNFLISVADVKPMFVLQTPVLIEETLPESPASRAGIQARDRILACGHTQFRSAYDFSDFVRNNPERTLELDILRNGDSIRIPVTVSSEGVIGVKLETGYEALGIPTEVYKYGFFAAIPIGISKGMQTLSGYVRQFKLIFQPSTGAYKKVGGFARMAQMFPKKWSWQAFWALTATLSLILAFMNFLPIPGLDGGYMLFILWEMITGKEPGEKFLERANTIGFIFIIGLLLYANLNDIFQIFSK